MKDKVENKVFYKPLFRRGLGRLYFIKTPWWLKKLFPKRIWHINTEEKNIYLSFDDGPHPYATPFVLDILKQYDAKATFFCIGKNVIEFPEIYKRIIDEGHCVGNHTHHHLNGWKTNTETYLADIEEAGKYIQSNLFRPPYGRLRSNQAKQISSVPGNGPSKIVMWDVLSGDFDKRISKEKCLKNVINRARAGSIIVFHDSEKAFDKLQYTLPQVVKEFSSQKFLFKSLEEVE